MFYYTVPAVLPPPLKWFMDGFCAIRTNLAHELLPFRIVLYVPFMEEYIKTQIIMYIIITRGLRLKFSLRRKSAWGGGLERTNAC